MKSPRAFLGVLALLLGCVGTGRLFCFARQGENLRRRRLKFVRFDEDLVMGCICGGLAEVGLISMVASALSWLVFAVVNWINKR